MLLVSNITSDNIYSCHCHYRPQLSGCVSGDCADVTTAEATIGSTGVPRPYKEPHTHHTNPYTVPVHDGDPRLCFGHCPAAPNTRGGLRARCSACNNNNNSTTAANRRSADRMVLFLIRGIDKFCVVHSIASFLVIMNIASYARPNYQYLPSVLYFTQKIANAAIIGKMRILWSRNVRNNTCCKYFRATISNDSCCCEMLIIIPPRYLLSDWTKVSIDNKTIYNRYLLTERSSLVPEDILTAILRSWIIV